MTFMSLPEATGNWSSGMCGNRMMGGCLKILGAFGLMVKGGDKASETRSVIGVGLSKILNVSIFCLMYTKSYYTITGKHLFICLSRV